MAIVAFVIVLLMFLTVIVKFFKICTVESAIKYFTKMTNMVKELEDINYTVDVVLAFIIDVIMHLIVLYFLYGLI